MLTAFWFLLGTNLAIQEAEGLEPGQAGSAEPDAQPGFSLNPDGVPIVEPSSWEMGLEMRARIEAFDNEEFGEAPDPHRKYLWLRFWPHARFSLGEHVSAFLELQAAGQFNDHTRELPLGENRADWLQGYLDVGDSQATLRVGRQLLRYGSERLVSARYGPNIPEPFDALRLRLTEPGQRFDLLYARPVTPNLGEFDDATSDYELLWGGYYTRELGEHEGLDAYYLGYQNNAASFNQGGGQEERHTLGLRLFGDQPSGLDWDVELFAQGGTFEEGDIRAWSAASSWGFTLTEQKWTPRLGFKANIVSGDDDPEDRDLQTFQPLFPKGQYFGESGILGPYNLVNLHATIDLHPSPDITLGLAAIGYWRESTGDGVYNNGGILLRDSEGEGRWIGSQFDLLSEYRVQEGVELSCTASVFVPGSYLDGEERAETVLFVGTDVVFSL